MKKVIFIMALVLTSALTVSSCTEDAINPTSTAEDDGGGGSGSVEPIKDKP